MVSREKQRTPGDLNKSGGAIPVGKKKQKKTYSSTNSAYNGKVVDKVEPYATERSKETTQVRMKALNISHSTKALPPVL